MPEEKTTHQLKALGWQTGCAGVCGSNGWRMLGRYMDSGVHYKQAYSWVTYEAELAQDGYLSFKTNIAGFHGTGPEVSLEFFVDNVPHHLANEQEYVHRFPLTKGVHRLLWVHHQNSESFRGDIRSNVSEIMIVGAMSGGLTEYDCPAGYYSIGGAASCTPCPPGHYTDTPASSSCQSCPAGEFTGAYGSTSCSVCGAGTYPNAASAATDCVTSCEFWANVTDPSTGLSRSYNYSVQPLRDLGTLEVVTNLQKTFYLRVCGKIGVSDSPCKTSTFSCEDDDVLHQAFNAGAILNVAPRTSSVAAASTGIDLEYTNGDPTYCGTNQRKTILHLHCHLGAIPYSQIELDPSKEDAARQCEYHFNIQSEYACPQCTLADLEVIRGECESNGERKITYSPLIPCLNPPSSHTETCAEVAVNEWGILIVSAIVVFICVFLIGMAVYFWRKKTQSEHKYNLLVQETTAPVEMHELDEEGEEGEEGGDNGQTSSRQQQQTKTATTVN